MTAKYKCRASLNTGAGTVTPGRSAASSTLDAELTRKAIAASAPAG